MDEPGQADAGWITSAHDAWTAFEVAEHGRDRAVVAIRVAGESLCSGALISPRLVLTARHCVSRTEPCPPTVSEAPRDLGIFVGDDVVSAALVAYGLSIVAPSAALCEADIAVVVLDEAVTGVKPLGARVAGPVAGERVRAVTFNQPNTGDPLGEKLLAEHLRVRLVSKTAFMTEPTSFGDSGGLALDAAGAEVVGVASNKPGEQTYTRVDAYAWLIERATAHVAELDAAKRLGR